MSVTPEQLAYQQALLQWVSVMESALVKIKEGIISKPDKEDPVKPTEGTIKEGGWGANTDTSTWKITKMRDDPNLFKVVDSAGKNVATHFSTETNAQIFIDYMKTQPVPTEPVVEPTDPVVEPDKPTEPGTGAFGVKSIFGNGAVITSYKENFRDDGKRFDFTKLKTKGQELTGFFRLTAPLKKDEISGKWSTVSHSGSNRTDCYDLGVSTEGGRSRFRFEQIHPEYTGDLATGQSPAPKLGNKFIGYKFIKRVNPDNSVNLQIYVDASGDNEGDKPANKWSKIFDHTDTKYKIGVVQPFATLRIDDQEKKGLKQVEEKWIHLQEIKESSSTKPDIPTEPTEEPQTNEGWTSIGRWDNGQVETLTGHMQYSADKSIAVAAGGGDRKLVIDGKGNAILSGHQARIYVFYNNYNATLQLKYTPQSDLANLSLKLRSRHQEPDPTTNRFGGYGSAIFLNSVEDKREEYHNEHTTIGKQTLAKPLVNGKEYGIRYTVKDTASGVQNITEIDYGNGFEKVADFTDKSPLPYMKDKNLYTNKKGALPTSSYAWIRINGNNSIPKNIQIRDVSIKELA